MLRVEVRAGLVPASVFKSIGYGSGSRDQR